MTVAKKLALLPLAALVGILVLAFVLLRDISAVYRSASYAADSTVPSLEILQKMDSNFVGVRLNVWQHVATPDIAGMDAAEKQMAGRRAKVDEAIKQYEALIVDDQDRAMFDTDRAAVAYYDSVKKKILELSRDGRKADAIAALMAVKKEVTTAGNQLSEHIAYLVTLSAARRTEAQATQRSAIVWGILLTVSTLILVVGLGVVIYRQLTRQLGGEPADVARVADRVAQGDFSSQILLRPGDSTSLYASVAKMQRDLESRAVADRARLEAESARSAAEQAAGVENARIRTALDRVSAGVMLIDSAGTIIYANDFVVTMLRAQANDIRAQAPGFDPAGLIGSNIESLVPGITAEPSGHTAERIMGRACFRVIATHVVDTRGAKVGTVVQWIDRTEEMAVEQEVATMVANAAAGDLRVRLGEAGKDGFFKVLAAGINQLLVSVTDVVRTMGQAAAEVSTGADEISRGNLDLSQRTEQQASSLEETAASMDQMTSMVKSNADNAAQANQLAAAARQQAERGGQVVSAAVAAMSEINGASRKIADIIGVIDDIAFQTNLLALNAAVEAARAGEQGRGFAVVASEVRNLASRSADAAKQIKGLIQDSVTKVADGARLVDESGRVLGDIVTGVKKVTEVMAEIAASSMEQASGIEKVNQAVTSMDSATQQNAALVEEASAAAQTLTDQAARLSELIARYRIDGQPSAAAPRPAAAVVAPTRTSGAPAVERRGPHRPFSGKSSGGRGAAVAADAEAGWQEF